MNTKVEPTPRPWLVDWSTRTNGGPKQGWFIQSHQVFDQEAYGPIAELPDGRDETEANAAHIVKCVNAHEELVGALRNLVTLVNTMRDTDEEIEGIAWYEAGERAESILARLSNE